MYLLLNRLPEESITKVHMIGPEMPDALKSGNIDAMSSWAPNTERAIRICEKAILIMAEEFLVPPTWLIVVRKDWAETNRAVIDGFLRGLREGIDFMKSRPDSSARIYADALGLTQDQALASLSGMNLQLSLEHAVLIDLESQAEWYIRSGRVKPQPIPNYLQFVDPEPLRRIDPAAVTLIK